MVGVEVGVPLALVAALELLVLRLLLLSSGWKRARSHSSQRSKLTQVKQRYRTPEIGVNPQEEQRQPTCMTPNLILFIR